MTRSEEIEKVELTPEELSLVIWQAKYAKYNREKNREYWESLERKKKKEDSQNVGFS